MQNLRRYDEADLSVVKTTTTTADDTGDAHDDDDDDDDEYADGPASCDCITCLPPTCRTMEPYIYREGVAGGGSGSRKSKGLTEDGCAFDLYLPVKLKHIVGVGASRSSFFHPWIERRHGFN